MSLSSLEGERGEWWRTYLKAHPNGVWRKIPADARQDDLIYFAEAAKRIILECEQKNAEFLKLYENDPVGYSRDLRFAQNDRDRQQALKDLLNSLWPGAMP